MTVQAVGAGEDDVGDEDVEASRAQRVEGFSAVFGDCHVVTGCAQIVGVDGPREPLVIDEEAKGKKVPKVIDDLRTGIKVALEMRGRAYPLGKVSARPAHQKAGLQLADFLAAALVVPWPTCTKSLASWRIDHWQT